jgi:hypothetical protein
MPGTTHTTYRAGALATLVLSVAVTAALVLAAHAQSGAGAACRGQHSRAPAHATRTC